MYCNCSINHLQERVMFPNNSQAALLCPEPLSLLVHSFTDERHPADALVSGARVDLVHLREAGGAGTDQKHGFVIMGHFPDDQPSKGDH